MKLFLKFAFLSCPMLAGCGESFKTEETSNAKIINGKETSDFDAVTQIVMEMQTGQKFACTGTFIEHDLVLTAAHCLVDVKSVYLNNPEGAKHLRIFRTPQFLESNRETKYDVAIVQFPKNSAKETFSIASQLPKNGDQVSLIGFGQNDYTVVNGKIQPSSSSKPGIKRTGINHFSTELSIDGSIVFAGKYANEDASGKNASIAQRDSGGPLLNKKNEIIGVASKFTAANDGTTVVSMESKYIDLTSEFSKSFIKAAKAKAEEHR